jgi:tRNA nucleotidyltransferase (CCA-adding enzyme)
MRLEEETRSLAARADLGTVSRDRVNAELSRLAVEPGAGRGFALLAELGIAGIAPDGPQRAAAVARLFEDRRWAAVADAGAAILAAARSQTFAEAQSLVAAGRPSPSDAVELAGTARPEAIALARALGAEWLDDWLSEWRQVRLEITGEDLIAEGVEEGPAIGRGLAEALRAKLDGRASGREEELAIALHAAGDG